MARKGSSKWSHCGSRSNTPTRALTKKSSKKKKRIIKKRNIIAKATTKNLEEADKRVQGFNLLMSGYSDDRVSPQEMPKIWYPIDQPHILVIDLLHDTEKMSVCTPWIQLIFKSWFSLVISLMVKQKLEPSFFYATLMMGFLGLVIIGCVIEFYEVEVQRNKRKETQGDYIYFLHLHGVDPEIATISDFFKHEKVKKRLIKRGITIAWETLVLHSDASDSSDSDSTW